MAERCLICTGPIEDGAASELHPKCARKLFGTARVPEIELDPANLYLFGQQMAGKVTLSGVQSKVALGWSGKVLRVAAGDSVYILKPQSTTFPELPENEHVCMLLAREADIQTAETGLVRLKGSTLGLLSRRFDRQDGRRIPMEDFCQLAEVLPREKYAGSAELCARIVRQYSGEPGVDLLRLFRQVLFSWWIGNGDLHLKNVALLTDAAGRPRLSPAYDLLSTAIVIRDDPLALPVNGKKHGLHARDWLEFAAYCGLPEKLARSEIGTPSLLLERGLDLVERCFLGPAMRSALAGLLRDRAELLRAG